MEYEDFAKSRQDLFRLLDNHSDLTLWFPKLVKQLLEPNSCDLNSRSMKEMIDLAAQSCAKIDFEAILEQKDSAGNNMLMELAKNMKDDALREFLTNTYSSSFVSWFFKSTLKSAKMSHAQKWDFLRYFYLVVFPGSLCFPCLL